MWTGIIIHFINNTIAVISMTVSQNFSDEITNMFAMILYTVVFAVGIICFALYANDRKQKALGGAFSKNTLSRGLHVCSYKRRKSNQLYLQCADDYCRGFAYCRNKPLY